MADYRIFFRKSVQKDLSPIPRKDLKQIIEKIETLRKDPRPPGCEKLTGQNRYRIRRGNYRILYSIQDDQQTLWIVKVGHRRDVYR